MEKANTYCRPNDQKLFYGLFLKYRDAQLENYIPDLEHSTSDYHHVRPLALTKTYSTRQFPQSKSKGHKRQISRFTVISNVAETEHSYDPFKASRFQHLNAVRGAEQAKITVHHPHENRHVRRQTEPQQDISIFSNAPPFSGHFKYEVMAPPRVLSSRSSLASSTRSRNSARHMRAPIRYKRGVSFAHIRRRSGGHQAQFSRQEAGERHTSYPEATGADSGTRYAMTGSPGLSSYIRSKKCHSIASQPLLSIPGPARASQLWTDDVRQLSSSLAKDCDEAFNRSSVELSSIAEKRNSSTSSYLDSDIIGGQPSTPVQSRPTAAVQQMRQTSLRSRPLPIPPARSESVHIALLEAKRQAELRKSTGEDGSPRYLDRMVSHIDRLIQPSSPLATYPNHRTSSVPVDGIRVYSGRPLPSIHEAFKEDDSPRRPTDVDKYKGHHRGQESKANRTASAPEPRVSKSDHDPFATTDSHMKDTIRVVHSPILDGPVQIPAPLTIRKKSSQAAGLPLRDASSTDMKVAGLPHRTSSLGLQQQYTTGVKCDSVSNVDCTAEIPDKYCNESNTGTIVKKKSTWFKRSSKSGDENEWKMSIGGGHATPSHSSSNVAGQTQEDIPLPFLQKKKGFNLGRLFKRRPSNSGMTLGGKLSVFTSERQQLIST